MFDRKMMNFRFLFSDLRDFKVRQSKCGYRMYFVFNIKFHNINANSFESYLLKSLVKFDAL